MIMKHVSICVFFPKSIYKTPKTTHTTPKSIAPNLQNMREYHWHVQEEVAAVKDHPRARRIGWRLIIRKVTYVRKRGSVCESEKEYKEGSLPKKMIKRVDLKKGFRLMMILKMNYKVEWCQKCRGINCVSRSSRNRSALSVSA